MTFIYREYPIEFFMRAADNMDIRDRRKPIVAKFGE